MKTTYKSILITALIIATNNIAAAELEFNSAEIAVLEQEVEPKFQLQFFPGIKKHSKKSLAMHMVETSNDNADILNLNSSLTGSANALNTKKYFDDIEVIDNNLFELRF